LPADYAAGEVGLQFLSDEPVWHRPLSAGRLGPFQANLSRGRGARQAADGNVIDSGGRDTFYVFQCDTAACFKLDIAFPQGNSFSHLSGRHVVEKNDVYALDVGESARLFQIISFHFNADVWL